MKIQNMVKKANKKGQDEEAYKSQRDKIYKKKVPIEFDIPVIPVHKTKEELDSQNAVSVQDAISMKPASIPQEEQKGNANQAEEVTEHSWKKNETNDAMDNTEKKNLSDSSNNDIKKQRDTLESSSTPYNNEPKQTGDTIFSNKADISNCTPFKSGPLDEPETTARTISCSREGIKKPIGFARGTSVVATTHRDHSEMTDRIREMPQSKFVEQTEVMCAKCNRMVDIKNIGTTQT